MKTPLITISMDVEEHGGVSFLTDINTFIYRKEWVEAGVYHNLINEQLERIKNSLHLVDFGPCKDWQGTILETDELGNFICYTNEDGKLTAGVDPRI